MQKHVLLVHCDYNSIPGLALIFILVYLDWHCSLYLSRLLGVLSLWSSMLVIAFMKHHCFLGLLALKCTHLVCFRNEVISCWRGITIAGTFSVEGKCYASNPEWLKRRVYTWRNIRRMTTSSWSLKSECACCTCVYLHLWLLISRCRWLKLVCLSMVHCWCG